MPPKQKSLPEVAQTTSGMTLREANNRRPPSNFTPEPAVEKGSKLKGNVDPPPPPLPVVDPPSKKSDAMEKGKAEKGSKKVGKQKKAGKEKSISDLELETEKEPTQTLEPTKTTKKKKTIQLQLRRSPRGGRTNISFVKPPSQKYPSKSLRYVDKEPVNWRAETEEFNDDEEDFMLTMEAEMEKLMTMELLTMELTIMELMTMELLTMELMDQLGMNKRMRNTSKEKQSVTTVKDLKWLQMKKKRSRKMMKLINKRC